MTEKRFFQDYMPGAVCFGCGTDNPKGLHIRSYWENDEGVCQWHAESNHEGWSMLTCGGIIATLIDCHCIGTAMATAKRNENRELDSEPHYLFATGSLNIRYLKPTPISHSILLRAHVTDIKNNKKYSLSCDLYANQVKTVEAQVVAFLVYRSDQPDDANTLFKK